MKKMIFFLVLILVLSGCKNKEKEINCTYKDEKNDTMKSYMQITLIHNEEIILTEKLNAIYKFATSEAATSNYSNIEEILEKESTVTLKQVDNRIKAEGQKDVSEKQYDVETKVAYYEGLGYTCK